MGIYFLFLFFCLSSPSTSAFFCNNAFEKNPFASLHIFLEYSRLYFEYVRGFRFFAGLPRLACRETDRIIKQKQRSFEHGTDFN